MDDPRLLAVDWSGRSGTGQRQAIWLAEVVGGELVRLEGGRSRTELVELLVAETDNDPNLIVGFDFAFSLPAWYLRDHQLTPRQLWALVADEALTPVMRRAGLARWMNNPEPPFWTTSEAHARLRAEQRFRRTENDLRVPGVQPKSVFQLVGAGQVGRGSLYGMQALHRLAGAGYRIWPFDPPALPLAVEIFPRVLTGPVRKSSQSERERYLGAVPMPSDLRRLAAASEDAFDAAVSALVMAGRVEELRALPAEPSYTIEGKIWHPRRPARSDPARWRSRPAGRMRSYGLLDGAAVAVVAADPATQGPAARRCVRVADDLDITHEGRSPHRHPGGRPTGRRLPHLDLLVAHHRDPAEPHVHAVGHVDLDVTHDGGGDDLHLTLGHLGPTQVEHHVTHQGDCRQRPLDPPPPQALTVPHHRHDPLAAGPPGRPRRHRRGPGHGGQVSRDRGQLTPGGGRVGSPGPIGQLRHREAPLDRGHPQSLHDRFTLGIRRPDLPGRAVLTRFLIHAPTIRRAGSFVTPPNLD